MTSRLVGSLAAGCALVLGTAIPVVLLDHRGSSAVAASVRAPSLSSMDRRVLRSDAAFVASLPVAIAEVPKAAADVAGINLARARTVLGQLVALRPLAQATAGRSAAVSALEAAYREVAAGGSPHAAKIPTALESVQEIEGDVLPAIRLVALRQGRQLSAAAAFRAVESDPSTVALARVLAGWPRLYGALLLVEQDAAG